MTEKSIDQKAIDFVINMVNTLDKRVEIYLDSSAIHLFLYLFHLTFQGKKFELEFGRARMDDFEIAIEKYSGTDYYYVLENSIKFKIYIELGSNGLLTDFEISSEIINAKEDRWIENSLGYKVSLNPRMSDLLNQGLMKLSAFLDKLITQYNINRQDIKDEKQLIDKLINYYKKNGNLSSDGVAGKNLGLLKAAATCLIIDKEKERSHAVIPIVKNEINNQIYEIVRLIREDPFCRIKMPEFIEDYYAANKDNKTNGLQVSKTDDLDSLLDKLNQNLKKKRIGAWDTFKSDNPDRLSQSANSMVELLDKVIGQVCKDKNLSQCLEEKYGSEEAKWIEAQRKLISETKSNLNRVKHHVDYKNETITKGLLTTAETIMTVLLQ
jgi:hypothetical protein